MATIGRNSPCPCGCGKKYKVCRAEKQLEREKRERMVRVSQMKKTPTPGMTLLAANIIAAGTISPLTTDN